MKSIVYLSVDLDIEQIRLIKDTLGRDRPYHIVQLAGPIKGIHREIEELIFEQLLLETK